MSARDRLEDRVEERLEAWLPRWITAAGLATVAVEAMLSFDGLLTIAEQWLDEHYPEDVPLVCDPNSPDPGPRLAAALRDCLEVRA